jgi:hypothetical protein
VPIRAHDPSLRTVAARAAMCDCGYVSPSERLVSVHLVSRRHIDFRRVGSAVCPG